MIKVITTIEIQKRGRLTNSIIENKLGSTWISGKVHFVQDSSHTYVNTINTYGVGSYYGNIYKELYTIQLKNFFRSSVDEWIRKCGMCPYIKYISHI